MNNKRHLYQFQHLGNSKGRNKNQVCISYNKSQVSQQERIALVNRQLVVPMQEKNRRMVSQEWQKTPWVESCVNMEQKQTGESYCRGKLPGMDTGLQRPRRSHGLRKLLYNLPSLKYLVPYLRVKLGKLSFEVASILVYAVFKDFQ